MCSLHEILSGPTPFVWQTSIVKCAADGCFVAGRLLTNETKLYTEMISAEEVVSGNDTDRARLLRTCRDESPVAIQMGGSHPQRLAEAISILKAAKASEWVEINLNCGCPSPRVAHQSDSCFGARLMHDPERVKQCVEAMSRASGSVPITVKCRLGTDERNGYDRLSAFVRTVSSSGVRHFAVHARECVLEGLNPAQVASKQQPEMSRNLSTPCVSLGVIADFSIHAQNRSIPPLMPRWVHMLQRDFPELSFAVNGGVKTLGMAERHLGLSTQEYGSYEGVMPVSTDTTSPASHVVESWSELPPVREVITSLLLIVLFLLVHSSFLSGPA